MTHIGSCFCGAVEVEVTGSPEAMGYCHCPLLPVVVRWAGERLQPLDAAGRAHQIGRRTCRNVSKDELQPAPVLREVRRSFDGQSIQALVSLDVFAATIPTLGFTPGVHINYARRCCPMRDGLPS